MVATLAYALAALLALGIIFIGARFLVAPRVAAAGFGIPSDPAPWLSVKGVRDIASGIFVLVLLANHAPHVLGWFVLAAAIIPVGDGLIVLGAGGPKVVAYGVHWGTAIAMLAIAALLILGA